MEYEQYPPELEDSDDGADEFADENKKEQLKKMKAKSYPGDDQGQEYDATMAALFEKVPPGEGDEFAAVKPWLGAIKEPKDHPKPVKKAPDVEYAVDWVYGYRSEEARQNAQFNHLGQAVYPTAALGVVFDYKKMSQLYFGGGKTTFGGRKQLDESKDGHSDDVTALCLSLSRKLVASGQNGQQPLIFLWSAENAKIIGKKRLPKGARLVTALAMSPSEKYLVASDAAEKITAHLFDVQGGAAPICSVTINMKVVHLAFSPLSDTLFATAGKDHMMLCNFDGTKTIKGTKGKSKGGKVESQCAVAFPSNAQYKADCFTGGSDGKIYHWKNDEVAKFYDNNKGSVMSIACRSDDKVGELVIAGGSDKTLSLYKFTGSLQKMWVVEVAAAPRSVDLFQGRFLLGLKNGSLVDMPLSTDGSGRQTTVMTSHCDGEVWGLDVQTLDDGSLRLLTSADDNRILCYNVKEHKALAEGLVGAPGKKKAAKGYRGGASSMSSQPAECQSRCVAYCAAVNHLAVANNKGIVTIREVDWALVDQRDSIGLNSVKTTLFKKVKKAEWIETMVYSPCAKHLAVGSHDNTVYLLDTKTYKKVIKLTGHSSFITAVDWAIDSKYIRSVCGAYELLFFDIGKKKRDPSGASNTIATVWGDQTCKFGWNVQGIFPSGTDGSHVNSVAMSSDQKLIASGDDYGLVNLYRNPLLEGHKAAMYRGHSEHVTSVKFSDDGKYLFSTGGQDQTTI